MKPTSNQNLSLIKNQIHQISKNLFAQKDVEGFILEFENLLGKEILINHLLQVSTDHGTELEIGFFTEKRIADITLSAGRIYSCAYPVALVKKLTLIDADVKWTLEISGEKKFDYNIVKPGELSSLTNYKNSLQQLTSQLTNSR